MKSLIKLAAVVLCSAMILSCEQDNLTNSDSLSGKSATTKTAAKTNQITLKVSDRGYLMFQDETEVNNYIEYITDRGLDEVLDLFAQYNFQPLNSTDYDKKDNPEKFTLNDAGLVQIGNTVFKISDDGFYLLSAKKDYMSDNAIYQMMAAGDFQPQLMNRFSLFKDRGNIDFNILDVVDGNPAGINEDESPVVPMGKFWGRDKVPQPCNGMGQRWINVTYRIFWMKAWETGYWDPC